MAELNQWESKDYLDEMRKRITFTFEEKKVFDKYIQLLSVPNMEMQKVFQDLMQKRSIDTATGKQLDIIGDIVGQPREIVSVIDLPFFGYEGDPSSEEYGDLYDGTVGGYYWGLYDPRTKSAFLNDDVYRMFIKAKIMKNTIRCTPEDVLEFISFVFDVEKCQVILDKRAQQAVIIVSGDLSPFEYNLLQYFVQKKYKSYFIPKALGVGVLFGTAPSEDFFSFLGVADGLGYGTYNTSTNTVEGGGTYASLT